MSIKAKTAMLIVLTSALVILLGIGVAKELSGRPQYTQDDIRKYTYWILVNEQGKGVHYFTDNLTFDAYGNLLLDNYVVTADGDPKLYTESAWQLLSQGTHIIRKQR